MTSDNSWRQLTVCQAEAEELLKQESGAKSKK
jgi:hypothetical protein